MFDKLAAIAILELIAEFQNSCKCANAITGILSLIKIKNDLFTVT